MSNTRKVEKEKIKKIISKDANLRTKYFGSKEGQCCVIGGLVNAAKLTSVKKALIKLDKSFFNGIASAPAWVHKALFDTYGLDLATLEVLQFVNDQNDKVKHRRSALIKIIDSLPDSLTFKDI